MRAVQRERAGFLSVIHELISPQNTSTRIASGAAVGWVVWVAFWGLLVVGSGAWALVFLLMTPVAVIASSVFSGLYVAMSASKLKRHEFTSRRKRLEWWLGFALAVLLPFFVALGDPGFLRL